MKALKIIMFTLMLPGLVLGVLSRAGTASASDASIEVIPEEIFLSPALIKKPVSFKGSGFAPSEMISIEMILPEGVTVKGVNKGEDVGIAVADTDGEGCFTAAMKPTATLNWFFQVGWTPLLKPDFKEAKPLPPGDYKIKATGLYSDTVAFSTLRIVPPPKKKK
ncbi:MAG: hypothetical protein R6U38_09710 [Desulfatiglandaceae bacterium]